MDSYLVIELIEPVSVLLGKSEGTDAVWSRKAVKAGSQQNGLS